MCSPSSRARAVATAPKICPRFLHSGKVASVNHSAPAISADGLIRSTPAVPAKIYLAETPSSFTSVSAPRSPTCSPLTPSSSISSRSTASSGDSMPSLPFSNLPPGNFQLPRSSCSVTTRKRVGSVSSKIATRTLSVGLCMSRVYQRAVDYSERHLEPNNRYKIKRR